MCKGKLLIVAFCILFLAGCGGIWVNAERHAWIEDCTIEAVAMSNLAALMDPANVDVNDFGHIQNCFKLNAANWQLLLDAIEGRDPNATE